VPMYRVASGVYRSRNIMGVVNENDFTL